jgi:hypothetical protein
LLSICRTNYENLTKFFDIQNTLKKVTGKDVQPQFCVTMVVVFLFDGYKIFKLFKQVKREIKRMERIAAVL